MAESPRLTAPPAVAREFRGVWVATVSNIDWPSRPGLPTADQQKELLAILDRAAELRLNAVVFQVRPAADALYSSNLEPWSEYLTGQMGTAPNPFWDPLAFAVEEAHRRGLELHAWVNPYRARHPSAKSASSTTHMSVSHPELVRRYGTHLWMDPGERAVREHSIRVILDIVRRYDLDGIHIDDYFYPYKERDASGALIDFPDSGTYARYVAGGGTLDRNDWRRSNVDSLVRQLYAAVKKVKPWVKVGISPFGIWRPGNPPQIRGFDSYAEIYADSRKWLNNGWLDYIAPQLYWQIARKEQSYSALLGWWVSENTFKRHLWPGNYTGRVTGKEGGWPVTEVLDQIALTRAQPGATGNIHFSMKTFMRPPGGLNDRLLSGPYAERVLVPASPWLDSIPPGQPVARQVGVSGSGQRLSFEPNGERPWLWLIRARRGESWTSDVLPGWMRAYDVSPGPGRMDLALVSAVDRAGNESRRAIVPLR